MLKSTSFPLTIPNCTSNLEKALSLQPIEFYSCIQFEIRAASVYNQGCPKEQQTSDNLIVKDYCFIIEIFDKGPVKLIKQVKIAHSFLQSVSTQSHLIMLSLPM